MYNNYEYEKTERYTGDNGLVQQQGYYYDEAMSWNDYLTGTFRWMAMGLAVTFGLAWVVSMVPAVMMLALNLMIPLSIAELVMVAVLSARVQTMKVTTARGLFLGYAAMNGLVFSAYFLVFELDSLVMAFLAAAVFFALCAAHGARTEKDLSAWGPRLMIGLVAMLVSSLFGLLFGMGFVYSLVYCGIGVVLFMLLTAYDTQKLKSYYAYYANDPEMAEKSSIYGALGLYLDFINIFLYLIRLFGRRRRN